MGLLHDHEPFLEGDGTDELGGPSSSLLGVLGGRLVHLVDDRHVVGGRVVLFVEELGWCQIEINLLSRWTVVIGNFRLRHCIQGRKCFSDITVSECKSIKLLVGSRALRNF